MWLAWEVNTWMSGEREGTLDGRAGPGRELGVLWNVDDFMERRWPKAPGVRAGPTRRQEPVAIRPRRSGLGDQTSAIRPRQSGLGDQACSGHRRNAEPAAGPAPPPLANVRRCCPTHSHMVLSALWRRVKMSKHRSPLLAASTRSTARPRSLGPPPPLPQSPS